MTSLQNLCPGTPPSLVICEYKVDKESAYRTSSKFISRVHDAAKPMACIQLIILLHTERIMSKIIQVENE
jgi:hypothetical protein